jgi:hypothetical protein
VKKVKQQDLAKVDKEITKCTSNNLFGDKTIRTEMHGRSKQLSVSRKHLIISSLYIQDRRINAIYDELKRKLEVDITPNAVAVLFRVFLECTVDYYIEKNKIVLHKDTKLDGKILKVVDHLEGTLTQKHLKECGLVKPTQSDIKNAQQKVKLKEIRKVATKDNNSILAVSTFHDFVHDYKISPIPTDLKKYWENLDSFFVTLWESFSKQK